MQHTFVLVASRTRSPVELFRIAQQNYLLVSDDDFAKASGLAKVMVDG